MQSVEKTFRYSYIFKNLGVIYLLFLGIGSWLILAFDGHLYFLFMLVGVGVLATIVYITTSVTISDKEISARTLLGEELLRWSDIGSFESTPNSLKLMNVDGNVTIRINSRLDGYLEILYLLYQQRGNPFDTNRFKSFTKNRTNNLIALLVYALALTFVVARIFSGDWLYIFLGIGLGSAVFYTLYRVFFTPQSIILETDTIVFKYLTKTVSISRTDIVSILSNASQASIILKNGTRINTSGFEEGPFLVYFALRHWYEGAFAK